MSTISNSSQTDAIDTALKDAFCRIQNVLIEEFTILSVNNTEEMPHVGVRKFTQRSMKHVSSILMDIAGISNEQSRREYFNTMPTIITNSAQTDAIDTASKDAVCRIQKVLNEEFTILSVNNTEEMPHMGACKFTQRAMIPIESILMDAGPISLRV